MKPLTRVPRCQCQDPVVAIWYEGKPWCILCALLCVGPDPAEDFNDQLGEHPTPGLLIGERPQRPHVAPGAVA